MTTLLWFSAHHYYDVARKGRSTRSRCLFGQALTDRSWDTVIWVTRVHPRHVGLIPSGSTFRRHLLGLFPFGRVFRLSLAEGQRVSGRFLVEYHLPFGWEFPLRPVLKVLASSIGATPSHVFVNDPLQAAFLQAFPTARTLADVDDDWRLAPQYSGLRRRVAQGYGLFGLADSVSANTESTARCIWPAKAWVLPNGWTAAPEQSAPFARKDGGKAIGIFGNNDENRLDWELIRNLMVHFPNVSWHVAGRNARPPFSPPTETVLHLHGEVSGETMETLHGQIDALLVPHRPTPLVQGQDSLKIYRALGRGLPVICPPIRPATRVPDLVYLYRSLAEAKEMVHTALNETDTELVARRRTWAGDQTWIERYDRWKRRLLHLQRSSRDGRGYPP